MGGFPCLVPVFLLRHPTQYGVPLGSGTLASGGKVSAHTEIHHVSVFVMRASPGSIWCSKKGVVKLY